MKKEDFNLINDFFNELSLRLFNSRDMENNYYPYLLINNAYIDYFKKRYFTEGAYRIETKNNNITFQDVTNIAREILETIDKEYLEIFDDLIDNGTLDYSYDNEYFDSYVSSVYFKNKLVKRLININRDFNYTDVEVLIHEFMHYISHTGFNIKQKIIGEFISIYFELYADEYIYKNCKIDLEELFYNKRLINIYVQAQTVRKMCIPLNIYKNFGNLNENSYKDATSYLKKYNKESYMHECEETLKIINDIKKDSNKKFEIDEAHYYTIATYLAFYFRKTSDISKIVNLANNIKKEDNEDLDVIELLDKYNLCLNNDFYVKLIESINEYLDVFEKDKKQRV